MSYTNHIRTMLLNDVKLAAAPERPGEEYVSADFHPRALPAAFQKIRRILFGDSPDRAMLNFRLYQCMQAIHASELEEYVTYHDTRITYLPFDRTELWNAAFMTVVSSEVASGTLTLLGAPAANERLGHLRHWFRASVLNGTQIHLAQYQPVAAETTADYVLTAGTSDVLVFPKSSVQFNFSGSPGDVWDIQGVSRPTRNMADLLELLVKVVGDDDHEALFGNNPQEPLLTFKRLWLTHDVYSYRLGALLLAMAFQTDALPEA